MSTRVSTEALQILKIPIGFLNDLNSASSHDDVLRVYAKWVKRVIGSDRATIALAEDQAGAFDLMAIEGNQVIAVGSQVPFEGTLIGRVYRTQTSEICTDLSGSPDFDCQKLAGGGLQSCMDVPLTSGEKQFGALAVAFDSEPLPNELDLLILEALARCLAAHLQLQEQMVQLSEMSRTDPLTRTFNRRVFDDKVKDLWATWLEDEKSFSLAIVDLDHFKSINDTHGHDFGDLVLRQVAETLTTESRPQDLVVRMGGEEFCVMLADTDAETAAKVSERLRRAIEGLNLVNQGNRVPVTASIGIATCNSAHDSHRLVAMLADEALYRAKREGRNRVIDAAA